MLGRYTLGILDDEPDFLPMPLGARQKARSNSHPRVMSAQPPSDTELD